MKKKLLICLCTLSLALGLVACGSKGDDTYGGRTSAEYKTEITAMFTQLTSLDEQAIDYNINYLASYEDGAVIVGLLNNYKDCYDKDNSFEKPNP